MDLDGMGVSCLPALDLFTNGGSAIVAQRWRGAPNLAVELELLQVH
jgi:hypothetical protein